MFWHRGSYRQFYRRNRKPAVLYNAQSVMSKLNYIKRFPPSKPCACDICVSYCKRPGWWTVDEASRAIEAGYADRMMIEMSPELTFAVLAPAFKGNEGSIAVKEYAKNGCSFFKDKLCELFGSGFQPLECRYCHHTRPGLGDKCHRAIGKDWVTREGQQLVIRWGKMTGFWQRYGYIPWEK